MTGVSVLDFSEVSGFTYRSHIEDDPERAASEGLDFV